jgi:hypothetical protein
MEDNRIITKEEQKKLKLDYLGDFEKGVFTPPKILDLACEMQLDALGDFVPLSFKADLRQFEQEIDSYKDTWVPYLHREGLMNDRQGLNLVGLPGDTPADSLSMPEAMKRTGRKLSELDFDTPTQLYYDLPSLHPILNHFPKLGRCSLVKVNTGGWFPAHRDGVLLQRKTFRIVVFLSNTGPLAYEWEHDYRVRQIDEGRAYYIDTKKAHRTHSYVQDSIHLVMNIPKTYENILRVCNLLDAAES